MSDYDPPPRRRRRRMDEYDDGWAVGDEDADFDDPAGYILENPQSDPAHDAVPDVELPPGIYPRRRSRRRMVPPYDRSPGESYHRDRTHRGEYGEYEDKPKRDPYTFAPHRPTGLHIPFWQILILVILGVTALLAAALACVAVLTL